MIDDPAVVQAFDSSQCAFSSSGNASYGLPRLGLQVVSFQLLGGGERVLFEHPCTSIADAERPRGSAWRTSTARVRSFLMIHTVLIG